MKIPKFLEDLSVISKLGDNPGADNGLTAEGLKAKFDEAALKLQEFLNDTLIEKLNSLFSADAPPHEGMNMTGPINMNQNKLGGLADPTEDGDAVNLGFANENYRHSDWLPTAEEVGAASAGYGYGEPMVWLGLDVTTSTFQEQLEALYASMPTGTCMQVQVFDTVGLNDNKWSGTLWKYTANYGYLSVANYRGLRALKYLNSGNWSNWLRDNPFGTYGTEYASMERWDGDIVYRKVISVGKLANAAEVTVSVPEAVKLVSYNGYLVKGNYYISVFAPNAGISNVYYDSKNKVLHITTDADRHDYYCYLDLYYTK